MPMIWYRENRPDSDKSSLKIKINPAGLKKKKMTLLYRLYIVNIIIILINLLNVFGQMK